MIAHPNVPMAEPSVYLVNYKIWHERMGHPSKNVLKHIGQNTNGFTPDIVFPADDGICPGCAKGKMHNQPFPSSEKRASNPFDLVHADLLELPIRSYRKKKYVLLILDDYSSYAFFFLLRSKDETYTALSQFLELVKNQFNKTIKQFRSDHGREFENKKLMNFLMQKE